MSGEMLYSKYEPEQGYRAEKILVKYDCYNNIFIWNQDKL